MIISAGQMLVLVIGGFDLSVGAVVALTSVAAGLVMADLYGLWPDAAVARHRHRPGRRARGGLGDRRDQRHHRGRICG